MIRIRFSEAQEQPQCVGIETEGALAVEPVRGQVATQVAYLMSDGSRRKSYVSVQADPLPGDSSPYLAEVPEAAKARLRKAIDDLAAVVADVLSKSAATEAVEIPSYADLHPEWAASNPAAPRGPRRVK